MQKNREKISKCPLSIVELFNKVNSLPVNFSQSLSTQLQLDSVLVKVSEADTKKRFFEIVSMLPRDFFENYPQLSAVLEGKTSDIVYSEPGPKRMPQGWEVQWKPTPRETYYFHPLPALTSEISWAIYAREGFYKAMKFADFEKNPTFYDNGWKRISPEGLDDIDFFGLSVKEGVISTNYTFPFNILVNEKIDIRRIKNCNECKKFYWLKRLNTNTENDFCENCRNSARQKRFIDKHTKTEINANRRRQRYFNDGVPFCEKCVRPNTKCSCYLNEREQKYNKKESANRRKRIEYYEKNNIDYCRKCFYKAGEWCECNTPKGNKNNVNL